MRDGDFRIRGKEISRVEGLSDAVFAVYRAPSQAKGDRISLVMSVLIGAVLLRLARRTQRARGRRRQLVQIATAGVEA